MAKLPHDTLDRGLPGLVCGEEKGKEGMRRKGMNEDVVMGRKGMDEDVVMRKERNG